MSVWIKPQLSDPNRCDIATMLRHWAHERPTHVAFRHLSDKDGEAVALTYAELDRRARAIASRLQHVNVSGEPVLLAYPPGLDFVAGLFGCFYAGCIAVPTSLPQRRHRQRRFEAVVHHSAPRVALTTRAAAAQLPTINANTNGQTGFSKRLPWLATDQISDAWSDHWVESRSDPESLAILQYTSGSTSEPKGVMLSHANLMHNAQAIHQAFGLDTGGDGSSDVAMFWLPTYHDMGLIGGVIVPIYGALTVVSMSPAAFLQNPLAWLIAISRHKVTITGGPNFAYDLCVRKVTDQDRAELDLSNWRLAFVGAEPVQAETLERFAEAFAPCGFQLKSFYPCYGLAEATLMVTGSERDRGANVHAASRHGIHRVSCGRPIEGTRVAIVQPHEHVELPDGEVGEVWVASPSVGQGYWRDDARTAETFNAYLAEGDTDELGGDSKGPFLRTGDLGFMRNGELFITSRRDDVMIIRGVNHYPQDIEATARRSHPLLEVHAGAAFSVADATSKRHVLVHEVTRDAEQDLTPVLVAASAAVLQEHDLALDAVVLVRARSIPRTSSGKIRRKACREAYESGKLYVLGAWDQRVPWAAESQSSASFAVICEQARRLSRQPLPDLSPETPMSMLGLDSLQRVELVAALEKQFGRRLPHTGDFHSLGELAGAVQAYLADGRAGADSVTEIAREQYDPVCFPELVELERHERLLRTTIGNIPYFRADEGGASQSGHLRIDGRELLNFCGYDYLAMAHDPQVAAAAKAAVDRYGTSACASRLVSGEKRIHEQLERELARFIGTEEAMVFVSGHATNVTTIGHLLRPGDVIVHDSLAHNSIIQGARLSGADRLSFPHQDWAALDALLTRIRHHYRRALIAIEGIYSMDGDWPELPRFVDLKHTHKTLLLVDEAHSLGTMGAHGCGIGEQFAIDRSNVDIWMGTLSKALGSCGGFIAGSAALVKYLKHTAPGFVYSVGISPANAAAALAALSLLRDEPQRVRQLRERAALFMSEARRHGLNTGLASGSPVVPVVVGNSTDSLRLSQCLFDRGFNVQPILSPAVPENAARLRFFITLHHTEAQIRSVVDAVSEELNRLKQERVVQHS